MAASKAPPQPKLAKAIEYARRAAALSGSPSSCLVAFSGGKDSLATLDVCLRAFDRVECFFMYFVDGLECIEAPLRAALRQFGRDIPLHKVPHWDNARLMKQAVYMPHRDGRNVRQLRQADVEAFVRKKTGIDWVAYGWRQTDSITRRITIRDLGIVYEKGRRFLPIAEWTARECVGYLRARRIPLPVRIGKSGEEGVSGIGLSADSLAFLRDKHPADLKRVLEVYPFAVAALARLDMYGRESLPQYAKEQERYQRARVRAEERLAKKQVKGETLEPSHEPDFQR